jgi:hypothetical protein
VQALTADEDSLVFLGSQLLPVLFEYAPEAAAKALAQPLLQLLAPAVMHCLQQQQQQQQQQDTAIVVQHNVTEAFLELLWMTFARNGEGGS